MWTKLVWIAQHNQVTFVSKDLIKVTIKPLLPLLHKCMAKLCGFYGCCLYNQLPYCEYYIDYCSTQQLPHRTINRDDVMTWKAVRITGAFVRGIHRWLMGTFCCYPVRVITVGVHENVDRESIQTKPKILNAWVPLIARQLAFCLMCLATPSYYPHLRWLTVNCTLMKNLIEILMKIPNFSQK